MRTYRFPDLRNGTTIHHITDTHFGAASNASWLANWMARQGADLDWLNESYAGHIHTGDMIHAGLEADIAPQTADYKAWRDAIIANDGKPFAQAVGNHDLSCFSDGTWRTASAWAQSVGVTSQNSVTDMGDMKVITVGPDDWQGAADFVLSAQTLSWLDSKLTEAGNTPCWIAAHVTFSEQFGSTGVNTVDLANPGLISVIDAHANAIGWLSGHFHVDINNPAHAEVLTVGGRQIYSVNGPPAGGGRYNSVAFADHQWQSPSQSIFVTYLGDAVDVRWRDHNARQWINPTDGPTVKQILLTT